MEPEVLNVQCAKIRPDTVSVLGNILEIIVYTGPCNLYMSE